MDKIKEVKMYLKKALVLLFIFLLFSVLRAQEHPGEPPRKKVTPEKALESLENYIAKDKELKGGFFIYDQENKRIRNLTLDKIHLLREWGENYYTCADFVDANKDKVDLDFYITKKDDDWGIIRIIIHKVNGKERYKPPLKVGKESTKE